MSALDNDADGLNDKEFEENLKLFENKFLSIKQME